MRTIERKVDEGREEIVRYRSGEKIAEFVLNRLLVWETAADTPGSVSALTKMLLDSAKKHLSRRPGSALQAQDRIYAVIMSELARLCFQPFTRHFCRVAPNDFQWKTINFVLCEELVQPEVLETSLPRIKYFLNAVLSLQQSQNAPTRGPQFSRLFTISLAECELLRRALIGYHNRHLGAVPSDLVELLPDLQGTFFLLPQN